MQFFRPRDQAARWHPSFDPLIEQSVAPHLIGEGEDIDLGHLYGGLVIVTVC